MKYTNEHPDKTFALDRPHSTVELATTARNYWSSANFRGFTTEELEKIGYKGIYECF